MIQGQVQVKSVKHDSTCVYLCLFVRNYDLYLLYGPFSLSKCLSKDTQRREEVCDRCGHFFSQTALQTRCQSKISRIIARLTADLSLFLFLTYRCTVTHNLCPLARECPQAWESIQDILSVQSTSSTHQTHFRKIIERCTYSSCYLFSLQGPFYFYICDLFFPQFLFSVTGGRHVKYCSTFFIILLVNFIWLFVWFFTILQQVLFLLAS